MMSPKPAEIARLLLAASADPNLPDSEGWIPLFCAAGNGHTGILRLLVEAGANVNAQCVANGWTALMNVACFGYEACVVELLALGADVTIRSVDGVTAFDIAKGSGQERVLQVFREYAAAFSKR